MSMVAAGGDLRPAGFLRANGCLLVQGFGLGRPQPAEAITELLIAELAADRRAAA